MIYLYVSHRLSHLFFHMVNPPIPLLINICLHNTPYYAYYQVVQIPSL